MRKPRVAATIAFSLAILVGAPAGAARAVSDPTGLLASDNVSLLTSIPNPGAIGARFRDGIMYVTPSPRLAVRSDQLV